MSAGLLCKWTQNCIVCRPMYVCIAMIIISLELTFKLLTSLKTDYLLRSLLLSFDSRVSIRQRLAIVELNRVIRVGA